MAACQAVAERCSRPSMDSESHNPRSLSMPMRCKYLLPALLGIAAVGHVAQRAPAQVAAQVPTPSPTAEQVAPSATTGQATRGVSAAEGIGSASEPAANAAPLLQYVAPKTMDMQIGVRVTAPDGNMLGTLATTVFPTAWPEQSVEIVESNVPSSFQSTFRDLPGGNRQLLLFAQMIPANSVTEATVTVRITKSHIVGPQDTLHLKAPKRLSRELSAFMSNSPYIEANSSEIKKIVRDIEASDPLTDWDKVEQLYDWVRENIVYQRGELKTVRDALRDRAGDCEEMTSTFVALCRAARIPARVVWIPNHCYPEFYLEDEQGQGHWFPCQVAGTRNFGSMPEYLPILQKGDRFKVPEKNEVQRYLADYLSAKKVLGRNDPQVEFIRQLLGDAANLRAPDLESTAVEPQP